MLLPLLASSLGTYSLFAVACLSYLLSFLLPVTIPLLLAESSIRILFIKVLHGMLPWTLRRAACLRRASFFFSSCRGARAAAPHTRVLFDERFLELRLRALLAALPKLLPALCRRAAAP